MWHYSEPPSLDLCCNWLAMLYVHIANDWGELELPQLWFQAVSKGEKMIILPVSGGGGGIERFACSAGELISVALL